MSAFESSSNGKEEAAAEARYQPNIGGTLYYYCVSKGRITGIFDNWSLCELQTKGYSGNCYEKVYGTLRNAELFMEEKGPENRIWGNYVGDTPQLWNQEQAQKEHEDHVSRHSHRANVRNGGRTRFPPRHDDEIYELREATRRVKVYPKQDFMDEWAFAGYKVGGELAKKQPETAFILQKLDTLVKERNNRLVRASDCNDPDTELDRRLDDWETSEIQLVNEAYRALLDNFGPQDRKRKIEVLQNHLEESAILRLAFVEDHEPSVSNYNRWFEGQVSSAGSLESLIRTSNHEIKVEAAKKIKAEAAEQERKILEEGRRVKAAEEKKIRRQRAAAQKQRHQRTSSILAWKSSDEFASDCSPSKVLSGIPLSNSQKQEEVKLAQETGVVETPPASPEKIINKEADKKAKDFFDKKAKDFYDNLTLEESDNLIEKRERELLENYSKTKTTKGKEATTNEKEGEEKARLEAVDFLNQVTADYNTRSKSSGEKATKKKLTAKKNDDDKKRGRKKQRVKGGKTSELKKE